MHVASLELCKELYELSGWNEYGQSEVDGQANVISYNYTLGYLLRKLPANLNRKEDDYIQAWLSMDCLGSDGWQFSYRKGASKPEIKAVADTPEDAACQLAIELFKQGILKRKGNI